MCKNLKKNARKQVSRNCLSAGDYHNNKESSSNRSSETSPYDDYRSEDRYRASMSHIKDEAENLSLNEQRSDK